jgi:hypothetical protein
VSVVTRVIVCPRNVVNFLEGGGHFWAYMQYVQGLARIGCDVYWLEELASQGAADADARAVAAMRTRLAEFGLGERLLLYATRSARTEWITHPAAHAEAVLRGADLLLNFHYTMDPALLALPRRTALVDIDPGLLQFWITQGQLAVPRHDRYLTIGETVGRPGSRIPDCGVDWIHFRPPVCLESWPYTHDARCESFTTVAGWWAGEYIKGKENGRPVFYENTKRVAFLEIVDLPRQTTQPLELALYLGDGDAAERLMLEQRGWRVRHSREVARTPGMYRDYIQGSRGEVSAAKPSCMSFQNAWVSDRTLCYLASGKPAVVQDTGPSAFLPNGEGLFRFTTVAEAARAIDTVNAEYARHCRAARAIAESLFDAKQVAEHILDAALA